MVTISGLSPFHFQSGIPDPPMMSKALVMKRAKERIFLEQLFNPSKLESYKIPDSVEAELRKYQQVSNMKIRPHV